MNCPKCDSEMEKGILRAGTNWVSASGIGSALMGISSAFGNLIVYAWKCSKCGKVELAVDTET